jgi:hypothetical protein
MLTLTIVRHGRKWYVGWPYTLDAVTHRYVLPTPEHDRLVVWWRESRISDPLGVFTIVRLLADVDLAVRRKAPPVAFELVRLGRVTRTYQAAATHCSLCGRPIREKTVYRWGPPMSPVTDWLNHARDCRRYGQPPDTTNQTDCTRNDSHFGGVAKTETATTRRTR